MPASDGIKLVGFFKVNTHKWVDSPKLVNAISHMNGKSTRVCVIEIQIPFKTQDQLIHNNLETSFDNFIDEMPNNGEGNKCQMVPYYHRFSIGR